MMHGRPPATPARWLALEEPCLPARGASWSPCPAPPALMPLPGPPGSRLPLAIIWRLSHWALAGLTFATERPAARTHSARQPPDQPSAMERPGQPLGGIGGPMFCCPWRAAISLMVFGSGASPWGTVATYAAASRKKPSTPAGPKNSSTRAGSEFIVKPCAIPRGPYTKDRGPTSTSSSPIRNRTSPSSTTKNSSSLRWTWMGDPKPFGPQNSTAANLPPVCSAVALMTKLPPPTNEGCASPPPGGSTYPSVLLAGSDMSGYSSPRRWVGRDSGQEFRRFTNHRHGHLLLSLMS